MRVTCVVQARMGSTRLPGKVLMDLGGTPLLRLMLDRLQRDPDVTVVVATSTEARDDAVAGVAADAGALVVRGDEADVLSRFVAAVELTGSADIVRLTADCPLVDIDLVRAAVSEHLRTGADYTSNTLIRTFPDGLDVEVVRASVLLDAAARATDPVEREHVTPYVYRRTSAYRLWALRTPERLGHLRWTVDTAEDLERVRGMLGEHPARRTMGWRALLGELELRDRPLLREGFEPAAPIELPEGVAHSPAEFCDPSRHLLVHRSDGVVTGWLAVSIDDGIATVRGDVSPVTQPAFDRWVAATPQITGGDLNLAHLDRTEATT